MTAGRSVAAGAKWGRLCVALVMDKGPTEVWLGAPNAWLEVVFGLAQQRAPAQVSSTAGGGSCDWLAVVQL